MTFFWVGIGIIAVGIPVYFWTRGVMRSRLLGRITILFMVVGAAMLAANLSSRVNQLTGTGDDSGTKTASP